MKSYLLANVYFRENELDENNNFKNLLLVEHNFSCVYHCPFLYILGN